MARSRIYSWVTSVGFDLLLVCSVGVMVIAIVGPLMRWIVGILTLGAMVVVSRDDRPAKDKHDDHDRPPSASR